ncbi:transmembrane protein, putative (macronuclear) [Tetrahymena thermophila SB210]|uniref:Transmembrane protein, putative n=1 Tax=Tetrahymena thermophila (strain SB210) TaxID=312017 RepID=I7LZU4_TETTS|nr:transmembrane protein, putative [Tetrahymena thermophila SB210]EAR84932.3 transmembrane protein, putative [Tetrahymena thermophila SB210]|eukprot:XP_001032595.3 transmembrane protein, putative [Tetrahymena thermophila SB210]
MKIGLFFLYISYIICKQCPQILSYFSLIYDDGYIPNIFLQIPQTNIMVICTSSISTQNKGQSQLYFADLRSPSRSIINQVRAEYTISGMEYIEYSNQILILSSGKIMIVNPISFQSIRFLDINNIQSILMISKTKYGLLLNLVNRIYLFDTQTAQILKTLDYLNDYRIRNKQQFYFKMYDFKCSKNKIIITSTEIGLTASSIDVNTLELKYLGIIDYTQQYSDGGNYRVFDKYPDDDVIFIGGRYLQLIGVQILNFETGQYVQKFNIYLYEYYPDYYVQNLIFTYTNGKPVIYVGTPYFLYYVDIKIGKDLDMQPDAYCKYIYEQQTFSWYKLEGTSQIYMGEIYFVHIFDYNSDTFYSQLYMINDYFSRRFVYEDTDQTFILFYWTKNLYYSKIETLQDLYHIQTNKFTYGFYVNYNSFYRVKGCELCLFAKLRDTADYVSTTLILPMDSRDNTQPIQTNNFNFTWDIVGLTLDPFWHVNSTWFVLSFPDKSKLSQQIDGLFYLINAQNTSQFYTLTSPYQSDNLQNTMYAVASLEDVSNPEVIGIDEQGKIYVWDLNSPTYEFKYSLQLRNCLQAQIAETFYYNTVKKLIIICGDRSVYSFDLKTQNQQYLISLVSIPISLRAFSSISVIAVPDMVASITYLYKYNSQSGEFDFLISIYQSQQKFDIYHIELLKDNTLWIQYKYNFIFYPLQDCLDDPSFCTSCQTTFYFDITNQQESITATYGQGTELVPFTSSNSYIEALLIASHYKDIVFNLTNLEINIILDPRNTIYLNTQFFDISFQNLVTLNIKSKSNELAQIQYDSLMQFNNYQEINFENILVSFMKQSCGLQFQNVINSVNILNVQLKSQYDSSISCQQIIADNSFIQILNYTLDDQNFKNNKFFISTINTDKVSISNLTISNSNFGEQFSILYQQTDVQAFISNLVLQNNYCQIKTNSQNTVPLFTAGHFKVSNVQIQNNTFCYNDIFQTITSFSHPPQTFTFKEIQVSNNTFYTQTNYLFFNSLYSILSQPSHQLIVQDARFFNNSLQIKSSSDLNIASFFQTNKIQNIIMSSVSLLTHYNISLGTFEYSNLVNITQFNCSNQQNSNKNFLSYATEGCIHINEAISVVINNINLNNKIIQDNSLIVINNNNYKQLQLSITMGLFQNLLLSQTQLNSYVNPIHIQSSYKADIQISNLTFQNSQLNSIEYSLTYSTTGIWIENLVGIVNLYNVTYENNFSNSKYNSLYIQSDTLQIVNSTFAKSSFNKTKSNQIINQFNQYGGMVNVVVNQLQVLNSNFSQSVAQKGSFFYISSFGKSLKVLFSNSSFSEGYGFLDGGAISVDSQGNLFNLTFLQCYFDNIYTFTPQASSVSIEYYSQKGSNSQIQIFGGSITNINGIQDNYFIIAQYIKVNISNVSSITQGYFTSQSLYYELYQKTSQSQQATLLSSENSQIQVESTNISNLSLNNQNSKIPLLIISQNSNIVLKNTNISNCQFEKSLIQLQLGQIQIQNSTFNNIRQIAKQRNIQQIKEVNPSDINYSIILANNSTVLVQNNSIFSNINCINCNGGAFFVENGNLNIQDSVFKQIQSSFGGAFFINGLLGTNLIKNSHFEDLFATYNGGALNILLQTSQIFSLNIVSSVFIQNQSINGRGGSIFVFSTTINPQSQIIGISETNFIQNKAQIGGALFKQGISPLLIDCKFEGNQGYIFGDDSFSYATKLNLVNAQEFLNKHHGIFDSGDLVIHSFRSGGTLTDLKFQLMNDQNEIIYPLTQNEKEMFSVQVKIDLSTQNYNSYQIRGNQYIYYDQLQKVFRFDQLTVVGTPGSSTTIQFFSNQIYNLDAASNQYSQNYTFNIKINFRQCISGEQIKSYNTLTECDICQKGQYSFHVQQCQDCPTGAICSGGDNIVTKLGYWRKTVDSSLIIQCENQQANCPGGIYGNFVCYEGHIGALCEECDLYGSVWGKSYSVSSKYSCVECDQVKYNLYGLLGLTIWTLFSMSISIQSNIVNIKQQTAKDILIRAFSKGVSYQNNKNRQSSILFTKNENENTIFKQTTSQVSKKSLMRMFYDRKKKSQYQESKQSVFIKILTNYFQIICSIATFNLKVPQGFMVFSLSIGQPIKYTLSSLGCLLVKLDTSIPIIFVNLIFSHITIIAYFMIFLLGLIFQKSIQNIKQPFPTYKLVTAAMFLIIYFQPDLIQQIISLMSCRTIGDTSYILSNVAYECYTKQHIRYLLMILLPFFILWILIFPILFYVLLRKNKQQLDDPQVKLKYGFLYHEYKQKAYYWELLKMAQKIIIILLLNFYSQLIIVKGLLVFIVIAIQGIISQKIKPFQEDEINKIDVISTQICGFTILLGVFSYQNPFSYFYYCSLVLIAVINISFIVFLIYKILSNYISQLKRLIVNFVDYASEKIKFVPFQFNKKKKKRILNPIIKAKVQKSFQNYLNLSQKQKMEFYMNIFEHGLKSKFQERNEKNFNSTAFRKIEIEMSQKTNQQQIQSFLTLDPESNTESLVNNVKMNCFQTLNNCSGYNKSTSNILQTQSQEQFFRSPLILSNKINKSTIKFEDIKEI